MADVTLYHNPGCSKSRGALGLLRERSVVHEVVEYLKTPLDHAALGRLLDLLGGPPAELVRIDARFRELGLAPSDYSTREQVIALLVTHPELMQRPVVVCGPAAVIARPPEKLLSLLD